jgi:hypothetical protein
MLKITNSLDEQRFGNKPSILYTYYTNQSKEIKLERKDDEWAEPYPPLARILGFLWEIDKGSCRIATLSHTEQRKIGWVQGRSTVAQLCSRRLLQQRGGCASASPNWLPTTTPAYYHAAAHSRACKRLPSLLPLPSIRHRQCARLRTQAACPSSPLSASRRTSTQVSGS